nr:centrosomal protein of 112 kDa-like [Lytechinus pictus]
MADESEVLDNEFDGFLAEMKPYMLKLPNKLERQRCALWIKKLCEAPGHGVVGRKNRNMYSKLLLHMLKKSSLEGPFSSRPDPGSLPTLPSYTSIYFDEPSQYKALRQDDIGVHSLPDWVSGELWSAREPSVRSKVTSTNVLQERHTNAETRQHQRKPGNEGRGDRVQIDVPSSTYQSHLEAARVEIRNRHKVSFTYSSDEKEDLNPRRKEAKSSDDKVPPTNQRSSVFDWPKLELSPVATRTNQITINGRPNMTSSAMLNDVAMETRQEKQHLEMRTKLLEAKFHEEKLLIQQRHDEAIQKILDRKNTEMEEMKLHYRTKVSNLEETNSKLEKKLQTLSKEFSHAKESRDKQITELRKMVEHSSQTTINDYEKRLHDAVADFEQDKFDLQKKQTSAIQDILEDTNIKLQKMEMDYNTQVESHAEVIRELEGKLHQLGLELTNQQSGQQRITEEKSNLERQAQLLNVELENVSQRYIALQKDFDMKKVDYERELKSLRGKSEARVDFLKEEHASTLAKITESNKDYEDKIHELRQALQDSELNRQRQVRELDSEHKQDQLHHEQLNERKLQGLRSQMGLEKEDVERQLRQAQNNNHDKEEQIKRLKELQRLQARQAERALEDFKNQVETNSGRMFDDMKTQMAGVEADLTKSKELREKQSKEYKRQSEEARNTHQQQLSELELSHQRERARILEQCQEEKDRLQEEQEELLETTRENLEQKIRVLESRSQEQQTKDAKIIFDLEQQLRDLKEEMLQGDSLRKQQLVELGLLREEERNKIQREHEAEVRQLRSEMDQYRTTLQKENSTNMEQAMRQTNERLKDIERDYTTRLEQANKTIKDHEDTIHQLREENQIAKSNMELQLTETVSKLEDEKELLRKQHEAYNKAVQRELDDQRHRIKQLERRLQQEELNHQEKVLQLQHDFEQRNRGLLPAAIKDELDATILSLKSQVNTLQQRLLVIQEEIDLRNKHIAKFSPTRN